MFTSEIKFYSKKIKGFDEFSRKSLDFRLHTIITIYIIASFAVLAITASKYNNNNKNVPINPLFTVKQDELLSTDAQVAKDIDKKEFLFYDVNLRQRTILELDNSSYHDEQTKLMECKTATKPPVIGILTQVLRDYKRFVQDKHLHIAASYVKWIESMGAQVLPILLNQNDSYYEKVFYQTNGLLFPGGDNLLDPYKRTPMMVAAKKLYKLAIEANNQGDYYPIWGTCLGLELLTTLSANKNVLKSCSANDLALSMKNVNRGKMFEARDFPGLKTGFDYSMAIINLLQEGNLTYNFHHFCFDDDGLHKAGLEHFYRPLAYSYDSNGQKFITILEAYNYPFFGVQFHPEKNSFEFIVKKSQENIPHGSAATTVSRYFGDFFISQAKLNKHCADDKNSNDQLAKELIYSYDPMYTGLIGDMYEQRYLFPYKEDQTISDEEFLDHIPKDEEIIPESVIRYTTPTLSVI